MPRLATSLASAFPAGPARELLVDHHYLVCAASGVLRLEAGGTRWTLPPSRAALIAAGRPVSVAVTQPVQLSSVLFAPAVLAPPPATLAVFDLTPLARRLLEACAPFEAGTPLTPYGEAMFVALGAAVWALAERPSPVRMPAGRSPEVRRALELTEQWLADPLEVDRVAAAVGVAPRTLARRFEAELGMTWRAALRRVRVLRAAELLAGTDRPVTRIAHQVGYGSTSAFNAAFRDLLGTTPTAYRTRST